MKESETAFHKAELAMEVKDYEKAKRFLIKSLELKYNGKAKTLLEQCNHLLEKEKMYDEKLCETILTKSNYYEILELKYTASEDDIKDKFIEIYKRLKQNLFPEKDEASQKLAHVYACLSDKRKRRIYDEHKSEPDFETKYGSYLKDDHLNPDNVFEAALHKVANSNRNRKEANVPRTKLPGLIQTFLLFITFGYILYDKFKPMDIKRNQSIVYSFERTNDHNILIKTLNMGIDYYVNEDFFEIVKENPIVFQNIENNVEEKYRINKRKECENIKATETYINERLNDPNLNLDEREILLNRKAELEIGRAHV